MQLRTGSEDTEGHSLVIFLLLFSICSTLGLGDRQEAGKIATFRPHLLGSREVIVGQDI